MLQASLQGNPSGTCTCTIGLSVCKSTLAALCPARLPDRNPYIWYRHYHAGPYYMDVPYHWRRSDRRTFLRRSQLKT